jgi:hypothetical protein
MLAAKGQAGVTFQILLEADRVAEASFEVVRRTNILLGRILLASKDIDVHG